MPHKYDQHDACQTHILERGAKHLLSRFPEVLLVTLGQVAEDIHQNNWKSCHHKG